MKIIYISTINIILVIFFISLIATFEVAANDDTCWLKAGNDDVFVRVFDLDSSGNVIQPRNSRGNFFLDMKFGKESWKKGRKN